ncbi:MAG: hypothetical protein HOC94_01415, partial [Waddliaceae bacterium]|nr:hypothetical protein [Waddliaceae bacterium]
MPDNIISGAGSFKLPESMKATTAKALEGKTVSTAVTAKQKESTASTRGEAAPSKAEMHDTPKTPLPSGVAVHSGETKDPKIIASAAPAASAEALKTFGKTLVTALD